MVKILVLLFSLGAFGWFAYSVPLGERTLVEHLRNIAKTRESQDLIQGAKKKVGGLVNQASDKVVEGVSKRGPAQATARDENLDKNLAPATPPMEEVQESDRKALRNLIGQGGKAPGK